MRKLIFYSIILFFALGVYGLGQSMSYSYSSQQQEDPGYPLYKKGYNLVLQANWKGAQKKFEEVLRLYPRSSYRDASSYWSAYCLKYYDEGKAIDALKRFVKEFRSSNYRSDALEDLAELQTRMQTNIILSVDSLRSQRFHVNVPDIQVEIPDIHINQDWGSDFPFGDRLAVRVLSDEMQDEVEWGYGPWVRSGREKDLDENTRLKISALRGIASDRDTESFRTVRDVLLDRTENPRLREEALRLFSRYQKFEILPTLKEVARGDPESRLRHGAIYYIGKYERDKDGAASTLIDLYTSTPNDSSRQKEQLLSSIARTRSERGMDFLVSIAKSGEDFKLRESALYWLGKYGEGKKKKALYEILEKK